MKDIKVVTICGSMKFKDEMQKIAVTLETKKKYAVLSCVFPPRDVSLSQDEINDLGLLHLKKISISDAIFVVNVNGYIGKSTMNEIEYAKSLNKEVLYLEAIN